MGNSILIIDDSDTVREQIIQTLMRVTSLFDHYYEAADGIEGFKQVMAQKVSLIVCDLEMPRMDGFKFLGMMQAREELRDIPVIMLTGREDRELKIKGLEQGACDYVTKPFDAGELIARVRVQLKIRTLQDDLKKSNEMLKELSNTDPLTQLYNRRYMMTALEREIQRSQRKGSPLSIVMMDIDHFKRINDNFGHQQGDLVLTTIATTAKNALRSYDIGARYGGEEFVLLLPETTHQEAIVVADRIRLQIQQLTYPAPLEKTSITISMGVATYPVPEITTINELIYAADSALYRAKETGRNRVVSSQAPPQ